jgi:hypothetical protein
MITNSLGDVACFSEEVLELDMADREFNGRWLQSARLFVSIPPQSVSQNQPQDAMLTSDRK